MPLARLRPSVGSPTTHKVVPSVQMPFIVLFPGRAKSRCAGRTSSSAVTSVPSEKVLSSEACTTRRGAEAGLTSTKSMVRPPVPLVVDHVAAKGSR